MRFTTALRSVLLVPSASTNRVAVPGSPPVGFDGIAGTVTNAVMAAGPLALDAHGQVWSNGTALASLSNVVEIAADGANFLALDASGLLWAWGANLSAQTGLGHTNAVPTPTPLPLSLGPTPRVQVALDADNDGHIRFDGSDSTNLFRFWINDDDDADELTDVDEPGRPVTASTEAGVTGNADYKTVGGYGVVDGTRDLVDFFPVAIRLQGFDAATMRLRIKSSLGRLNYVDAQGVIVANPFKYQTHLATAGAFAHAITRHVTMAGVDMEESVVNRCATDEGGLILVEARGPAGGQPETEQLSVEVVRKDTGQVVAAHSYPVRISGVEQFYRWLNLRGVAGREFGKPTDMAEPRNCPDRETNGKVFAFVHGYSVWAEQARGWNAEVFKRLWWSGFRGKFIGVTWRGDQGKFAPVVPLFGGDTPDYYQNVINAFGTARSLKQQMAPYAGNLVIAAHSLGNMLVSSAIVDHEMAVEKYYMLNAAVAVEGYDATSHAGRMVHPDWQGYEERLRSASWHRIFENTSDQRRTLTWKGRFASLPQAYNYHSTGEDVLMNSAGEVPGGTEVKFDGQRAWAAQEMNKGTLLAQMASWDSHGGWGFNGPSPGGSFGSDHPDLDTMWVKRQELGNRIIVWRAYTREETASIPSQELASKPFFKRFQDPRLHDPQQGSGTAADPGTRAKVLGEAIPAESFAAGANEIEAFSPLGGENRNINLQTMQNGWPQERLRGLKENNWLHSDLKVVPYVYVHRFYDDMVTRGGLE